jgi:hypothetical protein
LALERNLFAIKHHTGYIDWHVGYSLPRISPLDIEFIQADGDELDYVVRLFTPIRDGVSRPCTIPVPRQRVVRWYGDIARTIYANIH